MDITPKKLAIFKDKKAIGLLYLDAKGKPREFIFPVRDLNENSDVRQIVNSIRGRHRQKLAKITDEQLKRLVARLMKLCYPHKKYDFDFPLDPPRASPSYPPPSNQQSTSASAASSLLSGSKPSTTAPAQTKQPISSSIGNLAAQDLNKFDDANLAVAKKIMEVDFKKNQVKPGDPEYTYDVRKDFVSREESSWDVDEGNDDDEPKHDTNALKPSGSTAPKSGFNMDEFRASIKTTTTPSNSLGGTPLSGAAKDAGPAASNLVTSSQLPASSTVSSSLLSSTNPRPSFDLKTTKEEPPKLAPVSTTKKEEVHDEDEYLDEDDDLDATPTSFKANQYSFNAKGGTGFSQFSGYKGSKSNPGSALTSATQSREYDDSFEESGDYVEGDEEEAEDEEITIPAPSKGAFGSLGGLGNTQFNAKPSLTMSNTTSASNTAKANPTNFSSMYNAGGDDDEEEEEGEGEDEDYEDDEDEPVTATNGASQGFGMNRPGFGVKEFLSGSGNQGVGSLGKTSIGQSYGGSKVGGLSTGLGLGQSKGRDEFEDDEDEDEDEADTVPQRPSTGQFGAFGSGYKLGGGIGGGTGTWATSTSKTVQHAVDGDEEDDLEEDDDDNDNGGYYGKPSPVGYKPGSFGQQRQPQQLQGGSAHADDAEDVDDEEFEHDGDEEEEDEGW